MAKEKFYRQCRMIKQTESGRQDQVAWIPEKFAQKGKYVKLKDDNGWQVMSVGDTKHTQAAMMRISMEHSKHRENDM